MTLRIAGGEVQLGLVLELLTTVQLFYSATVISHALIIVDVSTNGYVSSFLLSYSIEECHWLTRDPKARVEA